jgi:uncharacterized protein (DUF433 family)
MTAHQIIEIVDGIAMISGRQVKAKRVASMVVNAGASIAQVMEQYNLSEAEVHAALAYFHDNRTTIEQEWKAAEAFVREVGTSAEEGLNRMRARQQGK